MNIIEDIFCLMFGLLVRILCVISLIMILGYNTQYQMECELEGKNVDGDGRTEREAYEER